MSAPLFRFFVGPADMESTLDCFPTNNDFMPLIAEEYAKEFWPDFDFPAEMTLLVIDPQSGHHQTLSVECAGYRFSAKAVPAEDAVADVDLWAVYCQKDLFSDGTLVTVQHRKHLAQPVARFIELQRNPKAIGVSRELLDHIEEIVSQFPEKYRLMNEGVGSGMYGSQAWLMIDTRIFSFVRVEFGAPIPDVWKEPVA